MLYLAACAGVLVALVMALLIMRREKSALRVVVTVIRQMYGGQ